jgi:hypothetical protein
MDTTKTIPSSKVSLNQRMTKLRENEETANAGVKWTNDLDNTLIKQADEGMALGDIVKFHKRTLGAIKIRLTTLSVQNNRILNYVSEDDIALYKKKKDYYAEKKKDDALKKVDISFKSDKDIVSFIGKIFVNEKLVYDMNITNKSQTYIVPLYFIEHKIAVLSNVVDTKIDIAQDVESTAKINLNDNPGSLAQLSKSLNCTVFTYDKTSDSLAKCIGDIMCFIKN